MWGDPEGRKGWRGSWRVPRTIERAVSSLISREVDPSDSIISGMGSHATSVTAWQIVGYPGALPHGWAGMGAGHMYGWNTAVCHWVYAACIWGWSSEVLSKQVVCLLFLGSQSTMVLMSLGKRKTVPTPPPTFFSPSEYFFLRLIYFIYKIKMYQTSYMQEEGIGSN